MAEQIRALAAIGWRVELVTWLDGAGRTKKVAAPEVPPELSDRVDVHRLRGAGEGSGPETLLSRVRRVLRSVWSPHASPELFHYPLGISGLREDLVPADLGIYHYTFAHAWLASGHPAPERRVVVHVHNRESEIASARADTASGASRWLHRRNALVLARHERALSTLVDELWFVSRVDLEAWRPGTPEDALRFVPPTFPDLRNPTPPADRDDRSTLGFVGTLDFEPNLRGVEWLVRKLAPELARLDRPPRVVIAGRGLPDDLRREGERWGFFEFRGFVGDLETSFWPDLTGFLVPDLHGIGVRIKLLEALARGLPTLTHPAAAAALAPDVAGSALLSVCEDPTQWREAIEALRERPGEPSRPPSLDGSAVYEFLGPTG